MFTKVTQISALLILSSNVFAADHFICSKADGFGAKTAELDVVVHHELQGNPSVQPVAASAIFYTVKLFDGNDLLLDKENDNGAVKMNGTYGCGEGPVCDFSSTSSDFFALSASLTLHSDGMARSF